MTHEEAGHFTRSLKSSTAESPNPNGFTAGLYQVRKQKRRKFFQKHLLIVLIPKLDKGVNKQLRHSPVLLMVIDADSQQNIHC